MRSEKVNLVEMSDWDKLVRETYKRPYSLQQQNGCMERGTIYLTVPEDCSDEELEMNDSIPDEVNGDAMGVKFPAWISRNPKKLSGEIKSQWENSLFWERNFYPLLQSVANDLYAKGLLKAGKYSIEIDW